MVSSRIALLSIAVMVFASVLMAGTVPSRFVMGTNFSGICDWGTEPVWKDYMKQSRVWCPQRPGMAWGNGWPLAVDSLNWITRLDASQTVDCPLFGSTSGNWTSMNPDSTYLVLYNGQGTIAFANAASYSVVSLGRISMRAKASAAPFLQITATNAADYLRDIRIVSSGNEASYLTQPWDESFLSRWRDFPVVRFMDWMSTNNSPVKTWGQRTQPKSQTQAMAGGVALEHIIDYCNRTLTEPWFCIPHMADDEYIRSFATLVRDSLDPRLKCYVEFSNECWNSIFSQTAYCDSMGVSQGLDPTATHPWEAGWRWYGRRSKQIFTIFEQVYGGTNRFVRVIASQMNSYVTDCKLGQDSVYLKTDAVAIAPYFGGRFDAASTQTVVQNWTVDQLLDSCTVDIHGSVRKAIQDHLDLVTKYNNLGAAFKLTAYEGGQHLVGVGGAENNQQLTDLFIAANRSARMYDLYLDYFEQWASMGGTVFCQFSSLCQPSKWGSWCALETINQDTAASPKYRALKEMIRRYPPPSMQIRNLTIDKPASSSFKAVATRSRLHLAGNAGTSVDIIRLNGSVAKRLTLNGALSNAVRLAAGVYFVHIRDGNGVRILPPYRILLY
jgi:hypothetical protein